MVAKVMEREFPECPRCTSQDIWRNGISRANKQQWRCKTCGRVFVIEPYLPDWVRVVTDRMIREGIPASVVASVVEGYASRRWVYERRKCLS